VRAARELERHDCLTFAGFFPEAAIDPDNIGPEPAHPRPEFVNRLRPFSAKED
jgi:hypothetical protein